MAREIETTSYIRGGLPVIVKGSIARQSRMSVYSMCSLTTSRSTGWAADVSHRHLG